MIPAAGFGTRLFPASRVVKKEMFPIIDRSGKAKPAILVIVEELLDAGLEEIAIICQEGDRNLFESLFNSPPEADNFNKLSPEDREYTERLAELGRHISYVVQDSQEGFGHAVFCARDWVGHEPFLLTLGDHLFRCDGEVSCTRQLIDRHERLGGNVVSLKSIGEADLGRFGCVNGTWQADRVLEISQFAEKPTADYAREHLRTAGIPDGFYLAVFGQYILSHRVFDVLGDAIARNRREGGEYQLTSCLDRLRLEDGFLGFLVEGRSYDIGVPLSYRQTIIDYAL